MESRFEWFDASLATVMVASTAVVVASGLVQVSFGAFTMSVGTAWSAVVDPLVWTNPQVLLRLFLGEGVGTAVASVLGLSTAAVDLPRETLIVWQIRMPRVLVGVLVGANLAVSGAVFQAVTRNELASPFILGVSSGAGLAILLSLIVFTGFAAFLPLVAAGGVSPVFAAAQASVAAVYFGAAYVLTGSLAFPVGIHSATNLWVVSVFGQAGSGFPALVRLERSIGAGPVDLLLLAIPSLLLLGLIVAWVRATRGRVSADESLRDAAERRRGPAAAE